jgi:hypothetical protein
MADVKTMVQTEVVIDRVVSLLAQDQNVGDLIRRIEEATATTGKFVRIVVVGNREVHLLVTPTSRASITVATVLHDPRDSGDIEFPYGGSYDLGLDG